MPAVEHHALRRRQADGALGILAVPQLVIRLGEARQLRLESDLSLALPRARAGARLRAPGLQRRLPGVQQAIQSGGGVLGVHVAHERLPTLAQHGV